jgi:endoglucanase
MGFGRRCMWQMATRYLIRVLSGCTRLCTKVIHSLQIRQPGGGGTDAGSIHKQREGIPSMSISVPIRFAHTPCSVAWHSDIAGMVDLLQSVLHTINNDILALPR